MDFFSKCCAKTHLPVLYPHATFRAVAPHLTKVVVLLPGCEPYEADYDGYGLGLNKRQWKTAKLVLQSAYAGESYEQLPESPSEPQKGYFFAVAELQALARIPSFASHDAYLDYLTQTETIMDGLHAELVKEVGAPSNVPWPKVVNLFETIKDCLDDPEDWLAAKRYRHRRAPLPALHHFLPENPKDAEELVTGYIKKYGARVREAFDELVKRTVEGQQNPSA